jgi:hypothetical protein
MPRLKHLVVVIPGIGGSELEGNDGLAWGGSLPLVWRALTQPDRLDLERSLRPVGLIRGITLLPGWTIARDYSVLIDDIRTTFDNVLLDEGHPDRPQLNADVLLFPYDFRQSVVRSAAALDATVRARLERRTGVGAPTQRVVVVAHSMGGLVARYWLGPLGGRSLCRALITLGAPHRGAPKALQWLVNGVPLPFTTDATRILRGWPGAYELLPRYRAVWNQAAQAPAYPHELAPAWPIDADAVRRAFDVHREIEDAWAQPPSAPEAPELIPFVGAGHRTPEWATWDETRLSVTKDPPSQPAAWLPDNGLRGDGTVPGLSAIPIELSDQPASWRQSPHRHGTIAATREITQLLLQYAAGSLAAVRGGVAPAPTSPPRLGLDLDECCVHGAPVPLRVELNGAPDQADAQVWAEVAPEGAHAAPTRLRLERDGGEWRGTFTGLGPGLWRVRVSATGVTPEPADVVDTFAVVGE